MISKPVFLCGFMGCGKSTHGKKLATALNSPFVDLDRFLEKEENKTIPFIFSNEGEDEFRKLESKNLSKIISQKIPQIISLGGGTVCFNNNLEVIKKNGLLVYIKMTAEALTERLVKSSKQRPLVKNLGPQDLLNYVQAKLNEREKYYSQADIVVNGINLKVPELKKIILEAKA